MGAQRQVQIVAALNWAYPQSSRSLIEVREPRVRTDAPPRH